MTSAELERRLAELPLVSESGARAIGVPQQASSLLSPAAASAVSMLRGMTPRESNRGRDLDAARAEQLDRIKREQSELLPRIRHPKLAAELRETPCALLLGPTGAGKTSAARWAFARFAGLWMAARDLGAAERRHPLGEGLPSVIRSALSTTTLYLDDLGTEEPRDLGTIQYVIDQRYASGRAIHATTGLTPEALSQYLGAAYVRRLVEQHVKRRDGSEFPLLFVDCHGGKP
ncbi:MAG: hypothetical protein RL685_3833 [Pseudomonadota bacterium]|jgi:hypothetical protein